jgi:hypothetical protein
MKEIVGWTVAGVIMLVILNTKSPGPVTVIVDLAVGGALVWAVIKIAAFEQRLEARVNEELQSAQRKASPAAPTVDRPRHRASQLSQPVSTSLPVGEKCEGCGTRAELATVSYAISPEDGTATQSLCAECAIALADDGAVIHDVAVQVS